MAAHVAVVVTGQRNLTSVTSIRELSDEALASFARSVAGKEPDRTYHVYEFSTRGSQRKRGEPLYVWHVGDGFAHADGWWVECE